MKRPLVLTGAIIATVFAAIETILTVYGILLILDIIGMAPATIIVTYAITIALTVLTLVYNILSITAWNKDAETFAKKRKFVITAIVFNFILAGILLLAYIAGTAAVSFLGFLEILAFISAGVLEIVGMRTKKVEEQQVEEAPKAE